MEWTDEEILFLKKNRTMGLDDLQRVLNRSRSSIQAKRSRLGITSRSCAWTSNEVRILVQHYGILPRKEVMEKLPGRSWDSIRRKSHQLRKKGYSIGKYKE